ncbi:MAG: hypothetical protein HY749_24415 [Gammaproteobacteria bacterium]|nr:hypothetical protein [Gammaproteobacteria bacterium]MBI5619116.1 hypothetical protein [Gammaproteobacteria bacterium]
MPATPARLGKPWTIVRTPVENLLLTGTDVMALGIVGAMMGGVKAAAIVEGALGFPRIVRAAERCQRGAPRLVTARGLGPAAGAARPRASSPNGSRARPA